MRYVEEDESNYGIHENNFQSPVKEEEEAK